MKSNKKPEDLDNKKDHSSDNEESEQNLSLNLNVKRVDEESQDENITKDTAETEDISIEEAPETTLTETEAAEDSEDSDGDTEDSETIVEEDPTQEDDDIEEDDENLTSTLDSLLEDIDDSDIYELEIESDSDIPKDGYQIKLNKLDEETEEADTIEDEEPEGPGFFASLSANIKEGLAEFRANRSENKAKQTREESLNPRLRALRILRRQRAGAGTLLLLSAFIALALNLFWANQEAELLGVNRFNLDGVLFLNLLIQLLAVLIPSFLIYKLYRINSDRVIGKSKQNLTSYGLTALLALVISIASIALNNISVYIFDSFGVNVNITNLYTINENPSLPGILVLVVVLAVIPALTFGFMFRGVIQTALASSGKQHLAILFTATAAALFGNDLLFALIPFGIAIFLSYAKEESDNLGISIFMHFCINLGYILLQGILPIYTSSIDLHGSNGASGLYLSIIFAIVALIILFPLTKATFQSYTSNKVESSPEASPKRLTRESWFPVDWKYMLALLLLIVYSSFA